MGRPKVARVSTAYSQVNGLAKCRIYAGRRTRHLHHLSSAAAAKSKASGKARTSSLDIESNAAKDIETEFKKTSVFISVALAVRGNRKENRGVNWADHEKYDMYADALIEEHNVLDVKHLRQVNRSLARTLHDAVFPGVAETIATARLRSILKTQQVAKIIAGQAIGGENMWGEKPWMMSVVQMLGKLTYRFESMTDMINGAFMDDVGELLSSVTEQQRNKLYEIDKEFEKMCELLCKIFESITSHMPFLR
jgi:hypothetical protein